MTKNNNKRHTLSPTEKAAISLGLLNNIAEWLETRPYMLSEEQKQMCDKLLDKNVEVLVNYTSDEQMLKLFVDTLNKLNKEKK